MLSENKESHKHAMTRYLSNQNPNFALKIKTGNMENDLHVHVLDYLLFRPFILEDNDAQSLSRMYAFKYLPEWLTNGDGVQSDRVSCH